MSQQKQRLLGQEVELMGSAVLGAAEMPMKVKKKAFLSNTCSSEDELPLHTMPRLCPLPGQRCAGMEGESQIVSASLWVLLSHTGQYPFNPEQCFTSCLQAPGQQKVTKKKNPQNKKNTKKTHHQKKMQEICFQEMKTVHL